MKVTIIGAGAYGTALGGLVAGNGYDVDYYDPKREPERLNSATSGAKVIILCAPSESATHLLSHLPKDIPLIVATKGFLSDKPFAEFKEWAVVSGPGFADEIKAGKDAWLTITSKWVADCLKASQMHFEVMSDKKAVLMCGALKNVYAILAGKSGLEPHTRAMRDFIKFTSNEMREILRANGANERAVDSPCGIKDLTLTCSNGSRNFGFGRELYRHRRSNSDVTVEGVSTLKRIKNGAIIVPGSAHYLHALLLEYSIWG